MTHATTSHQHKANYSSEPVRQYLQSVVMPTVTEALATIARDRPNDPLKHLAMHLRAVADKVSSRLEIHSRDKVLAGT